MELNKEIYEFSVLLDKLIKAHCKSLHNLKEYLIYRNLPYVDYKDYELLKSKINGLNIARDLLNDFLPKKDGKEKK